MDPRESLLRFSYVELPVIFDEIRVAHARIGILVVKQDLRLRPVDMAFLFDTARNPRGVAVEIVIPFGRMHRLAAMVVIPEKVFAIRKLLHEVRGSRMLDPAAFGTVCRVLGRCPRVASVAAIR